MVPGSLTPATSFCQITGEGMRNYSNLYFIYPPPPVKVFNAGNFCLSNYGGELKYKTTVKGFQIVQDSFFFSLSFWAWFSSWVYFEVWAFFVVGYF